MADDNEELSFQDNPESGLAPIAPFLAGLTPRATGPRLTAADLPQARGGNFLAGMLPLLMGGMTASPAQQGANAFSNAFYAAQGMANPYAHQQQRQEQQFFNTLNLVSQVQTRQAASDLARTNFLLKIQDQERKDLADQRAQDNLERQTIMPIINSLKGSESEAARTLGFQEEGKMLQKLNGVGYSPELVRDMATGRLSDERRKLIIGYLQDNVDPRELATVFRVPVERITELQGLANSPEYQRKYAYERGKEDWEIEQRGIARQAATLRQLTYDELQRHHKATEGLQGQANARAEQRLSNEDRRLAQGDTRIRQAEDRLDLTRQALEKRYDTAAEKRKATLDTMEETINQAEIAMTNMHSKGLLPQDEGKIAELRAQANRFLSPGDKDWVNLHKIFQGSGVGFERSVANDIGVRALPAYKGILSFYDNPPPLATARSSFQKMRNLIQIAREGKDPKQAVIVYEYTNPQTKQKERMKADWIPGMKLPPDARVLKIDDEIQ